MTLQFESEGRHIRVRMHINAKISGIFRSYIAAHLGCHPDESSVCWEGSRVHIDDTPRSIGAEDTDTFNVLREQKGGKPVIYLYSPTEMDVSVALTLTREWSLSVVYPVVPAKPSPSAGERIQWNVRTHADGSLTETNTDLDVAYLFWEAL